MKNAFTTIKDYISAQAPESRKLLEQMRLSIANAAPEAKEAISYGMPTFKYKGKNLVHFAAAKKHIGFYPTPSAIKAFEPELAGLKYSKGAVQFPMDKPLPLSLVEEMTRFRVGEFS